MKREPRGSNLHSRNNPPKKDSSSRKEVPSYNEVWPTPTEMTRLAEEASIKLKMKTTSTGITFDPLDTDTVERLSRTLRRSGFSVRVVKVCGGHALQGGGRGGMMNSNSVANNNQTPKQKKRKNSGTSPQAGTAAARILDFGPTPSKKQKKALDRLDSIEAELKAISNKYGKGELKIVATPPNTTAAADATTATATADQNYAILHALVDNLAKEKPSDPLKEMRRHYEKKETGTRPTLPSQMWTLISDFEKRVKRGKLTEAAAWDMFTDSAADSIIQGGGTKANMITQGTMKEKLTKWIHQVLPQFTNARGKNNLSTACQYEHTQTEWEDPSSTDYCEQIRSCINMWQWAEESDKIVPPDDDAIATTSIAAWTKAAKRNSMDHSMISVALSETRQAKADAIGSILTSSFDSSSGGASRATPVEDR